jgi:hypothetical protein
VKPKGEREMASAMGASIAELRASQPTDSAGPARLGHDRRRGYLPSAVEHLPAGRENAVDLLSLPNKDEATFFTA